MSDLARKLQVKAGSRVLVLGSSLDLPGVVSSGPADVVILFARSSRELRLEEAVGALAADGALWIAWPKKSSGVETDLARDEGWVALRSAGWDPVRQVSLDSTWSALRFKRAAPVASSPLLERLQALVLSLDPAVEVGGAAHLRVVLAGPPVRCGKAYFERAGSGSAAAVASGGHALAAGGVGLQRVADAPGGGGGGGGGPGVAGGGDGAGVGVKGWVVGIACLLAVAVSGVASGHIVAGQEALVPRPHLAVRFRDGNLKTRVQLILGLRPALRFFEGRPGPPDYARCGSLWVRVSHP